MNRLLVYIIVFFFISAGTIFAQGYEPLTPNAEALGITSGQFPSIVVLVDRFFRVGLSILGLLAVIMITIGGIKYMGSNSVFGKDAGKKQIQAAIGGLILGLGAWLLLRTINPQLVATSFTPIRFAQNDDAVLVVDASFDDTVYDIGTDYTGGSGNLGSSDRSSLAEQAIREQLAARGVSVNSNGRTFVEGFRDSTLRGIEQLVAESGHGFHITGGTESGHAPGTYSHANGYKVDIGLGASRARNEGVHDYIHNTLLGGRTLTDDTNYDAFLQTGQQVRLRYETDHWDITFYPH